MFKRTLLIIGAFALAVAIMAAVWLYHSNSLKQQQKAVQTQESVEVATTNPAFIYGEVTMLSGEVIEGRLQWGRNQESIWEDTFNGYKEQNPWETYIPEEYLTQKKPRKLFGFQWGTKTVKLNLVRPFVAKFGDIDRIETTVDTVTVTLKSSGTYVLDRWNANDIDDGLRVWESDTKFRDINSRNIKTVQFMSSPRSANEGAPNHRIQQVQVEAITAQHTFSGALSINGKVMLSNSNLQGEDNGVMNEIPLNQIQSIHKDSKHFIRVRFKDSTEVRLKVEGVQKVVIDDERYGRVTIPWRHLDQLAFKESTPRPAYNDYLPGRPLYGLVKTLEGTVHDGRLVYDLDESESTDTFEGSQTGIYFSVPFKLIEKISFKDQNAAKRGLINVELANGNSLHLEKTGDLKDSNVGILMLSDEGNRSELIPWNSLQTVQFLWGKNQ